MVGDSTSYPRAKRVIAINVNLVQHKSAHETITFHNLRLSRSGAGWYIPPDNNAVVRTPSGIVVRIGYIINEPEATTKDMIRYCVEIDQGGTNTALPDSPLYQRYHHPIDVGGSIDIPADNYKGSEHWSDNTPDAVEGGFKLITLPKNHVLPTLKFTVTQDTVIRRIPVRFVVPVTAGKPKTAWDGSNK